MCSLADVTRFRASASSAVYQRCVAEFASFTDSDSALLEHPLVFWVSDSMSVSTDALWSREVGDSKLVFFVLRRARADLPVAAGAYCCSACRALLPRVPRMQSFCRSPSRC